MYLRTVDEYKDEVMMGMQDPKDENLPENTPLDHPDETGRPDNEKWEGRKKLIQAQIDELKRMNHEFQERQHAILHQLEEIKRLEQEEQRERKKALRDRSAKNADRMQRKSGFKNYLGGGGSAQKLRSTLKDSEQRKGFLKLHIIQALDEGSSHGYELMQWISRHTDNAWTPSNGSMYPTLESMESKGIISGQGDGRRKIYTLTPKGQKILDGIQKKLDEQHIEMKSYVSTQFD
jgi:DNA-binding PadR family transcriptional regulator